MTQWLKELLHNCVIHPILPFLPRRWAIALHRWNGEWTFGGED